MDDARDMDATLVLQVGYRGADFAGFAAQPGQRTVAGCLVDALETFLRREVELTCAGRTDSGVHAIGQVVSIPITAAELELDARRIMSALSALTPDDISVRNLWQARPGFSARFDAIARHYRYRICADPARPILAWDHAWWLKAPLDVDAMAQAASLFVGEHDFKSLCKAVSAVDKPTCRYVASVDVSAQVEAGEQLVCIDVVGNAFLHSMVRTMTGTLVEVGRGRKDPSWVSDVLAACDRAAAGPCAPAKGLTFVGVDYEDGALLDW